MNVQQMSLHFPALHLLVQLYYYNNLIDTVYTPETTLVFFYLDLTGVHHITYCILNLVRESVASGAQLRP